MSSFICEKKVLRIMCKLIKKKKKKERKKRKCEKKSFPRKKNNKKTKKNRSLFYRQCYDLIRIFFILFEVTRLFF